MTPETKKLSVVERNTQVIVEFLLDTHGARNFPLSRRKGYRFDGLGHKRNTMTLEDANTLKTRYPKAFRIVNEE